MLKKKAGKDSMTEEKKNARDYPRVFYARHMESGLCGYENENILVDADAMKRMAPSFAGKPVYVQHQNVNLDKIQHQADGYVADCFYNELDGWLWSKIIVVSDDGNDAVGKGWKVSNAYVPLEWGGAGSHHNVDFKRKIVNAGFTHLAIVPDPRYENAEIYTPDQYRAYCETKRIELDELRNSKGKKMPLKFWKTTKSEVKHDEIDDDTMVELQNGKSISVKEMNAALAAAEAEDSPASKKLAADLKRYEELQNKKTKKNAEGQDEEKKVEEDGEEKINAEDDCTYKGKSMKVGDLMNRMKKNSETEDDKKSREAKENAEDKEEKENSRHFEEMKNARDKTAEVTPVDLDVDQLARGQNRYGTAKQ